MRPAGPSTFRARIFDKATGGHRHLGNFSDAKDAAKAYDKARRLMPSERPHLIRVNFPRNQRERAAAQVDRPQIGRNPAQQTSAKKLTMAASTSSVKTAEKRKWPGAAEKKAKYPSLQSSSERPAVISVAHGARHEREAAAMTMRGLGAASSNSGRWRAQVGLNHVTHCLGTYDTKLMATEVCHVARMRYARELDSANLELDSLARQAERAIKMEGLDKSTGKGKGKDKDKDKGKGKGKGKDKDRDRD